MACAAASASAPDHPAEGRRDVPADIVVVARWRDGKVLAATPDLVDVEQVLFLGIGQADPDLLSLVSRYRDGFLVLPGANFGVVVSKAVEDAILWRENRDTVLHALRECIAGHLAAGRDDAARDVAARTRAITKDDPGEKDMEHYV